MLRYLSIGVLSALSQFASLAFFLEYLSIDTHTSVSCAYVISVVIHFVGNKYFTFQVKGHPKLSEAVRYLVVVILNYLITLLTVHYVTIAFHHLPCVSSRYTAYVATILSIALTVMVGYILSRAWVFKKEIL